MNAPRPLNPHCAMAVVHAAHNRWSYAVWTRGEWVHGSGIDDGSYAVLTAIGVAKALQEFEHEVETRLMLALGDRIIRRLVNSGERMFQPTMFGRAMAEVVDGLERLEERGCTVAVLDPSERRDTWLVAKHLAARAKELSYVGDDPGGDGFEEGEPVDPETAWVEEGFSREVWETWVAAGWQDAPLTAGAMYRLGLDPHEALGAAGSVLNPAPSHAGVER